MVTKEFKVSGFSKIDTIRIESHLRKLIKYINPGLISIVGGLAIRYHLTNHGIKYPVRPFNDLDLMAEDSLAVLPKVSEEFLVYHYHPKKNDHFYLVLVDPESKTKVDIFDSDPPLEYSEKILLFGKRSKVRGLEDQLVKTVFDIQRISKELNVDPKQFEDTRLLMQIADINISEEIWKKRDYKKYPHSILKAIERAEKIANIHPDWVKKHPFKKQRPYNCELCKNSDGFKVDDMENIFRVLGYVE